MTDAAEAPKRAWQKWFKQAAEGPGAISAEVMSTTPEQGQTRVVQNLSHPWEDDLNGLRKDLGPPPGLGLALCYFL